MEVENAHPSALEAMAAAMAATLAPVRDADLLERECRGLATHIEVAAAASDRLAEGRALVERTLERARLTPPGSIGLGVPPDLGRMIRQEAARLGEDPAALALEVLEHVFAVDAAGGSLLDAVLDRSST